MPKLSRPARSGGLEPTEQVQHRSACPRPERKGAAPWIRRTAAVSGTRIEPGGLGDWNGATMGQPSATPRCAALVVGVEDAPRVGDQPLHRSHLAPVQHGYGKTLLLQPAGEQCLAERRVPLRASLLSVTIPPQVVPAPTIARRASLSQAAEQQPATPTAPIGCTLSPFDAPAVQTLRLIRRGGPASTWARRSPASCSSTANRSELT